MCGLLQAAKSLEVAQDITFQRGEAMSTDFLKSSPADATGMGSPPGCLGESAVVHPTNLNGNLGIKPAPLLATTPCRANKSWRGLNEQSPQDHGPPQKMGEHLRQTTSPTNYNNTAAILMDIQEANRRMGAITAIPQHRETLFTIRRKVLSRSRPSANLLIEGSLLACRKPHSVNCIFGLMLAWQEGDTLFFSRARMNALE